MKTIYSILVLGLAMFAPNAYCQTQTPTRNLMPDGSHDMYLGIGVLSRPVYEGAQKSRRAAAPVLQIQWSNGAFLAGMSAGWHLSQRPSIEYGPLISFEPGRSSSGIANSIDTPNTAMDTFISFNEANRVGGTTLNAGDIATVTTVANDTFTFTVKDSAGLGTASAVIVTVNTVSGTVSDAISTSNNTNTSNDNTSSNVTDTSLTIKSNVKIQRIGANKNNRLLGMHNIPARGLFGGFYNVQLSQNLSLANSILYGAGERRDGARLTSDLRYSMKNFAPHHTIGIGVGVNVVNQAYAMTYFGVSAKDALFSGNRPYTPAAGIKDIHVNVHWNWNLSASWLLTSKLNVSNLVGSAGDSPLVERRSNFAVSTAIAYRF